MSDRAPFTFIDWLKGQMSMLPLLALFGAGIVVFSDAHNDDRYVAKEVDKQRSVDIQVMQKDIHAIEQTQAIKAVDLQNIKENVQDLKTSQDQINAKLDRLIERR